MHREETAFEVRTPFGRLYYTVDPNGYLTTIGITSSGNSETHSNHTSLGFRHESWHRKTNPEPRQSGHSPLRTEPEPQRPAGVSQAQNAGRIELEHQIDEYLAGTRRSFDVRIRPTGTAFQTKVWEYLATIPFGETVTYEFIARQLGTPDAARAVGNAVKANKLLIVIPCHRVVPKSGGIGSFSAGVSVKKSLLEHERRIMEAAFAEGSFRRVR